MNTSLIALNAFRNAEGQVPFADFRKARHAPMLEKFEDEYEVASMNLIADLADENPDDAIGEMIAHSSDASFAEEGENLFDDAVNDLGNNAAMQEQMDAIAEDYDEEESDEPDALLVDDEGNTVRESEFVAQQEDQAKAEAVQQIAQQTKLPSYKQMVRDHGGNSKIESPVEFIRGFLDAHPDMTRKQAVAALVSVHSINYSTARTQYQKWFAKQK